MPRVARATTAALVVAMLASSASTAAADDEAPDKAPATGVSGSVDLANGDNIRWGIVLSAVRFRVSRRDDQIARVRDYQPDIDIFSGQFGFQVVWNPSDAPFTLAIANGRFQLFSVGFQLLGALSTERVEQSELAVTFSIGMLNNVLGIGIGLDLYRGVPALGRNGVVGAETAYTGLLSWAWATEGELTPENLLATIYLNVTGLVEAIGAAGGGS